MKCMNIKKIVILCISLYIFQIEIPIGMILHEFFEEKKDMRVFILSIIFLIRGMIELWG